MNRSRNIFGFLCAALFTGGVIASCNSGSDTNATQAVEKDSTTMTDVKPNTVAVRPSAVADISGTYTDTTVSGKATFTTESDGRVKMELSLSIPSKANKEVAVHIHETGDCGDMGKNSHGHWNPTNEEHGKWGSAHFHRGDIGNVKLDAQGNGSLEMTTDLWQLGGDETKNILGRALIVHGGVDDFVTQPTGNAGNRIGCGVIQ